MAAEVNHNTAIGVDLFHGGVQLRATLTLQGAHSFTGEALGVQAHQHPIPWVAGDNRNVVSASGSITIGVEVKNSVFGGNPGLHLKDDALVCDSTVAGRSSFAARIALIEFLEQLGNGHHRNVFALPKVQQLGQPEELTVIADNLTDDGDWFEAG
jgi:hypothetical protein